MEFSRTFCRNLVGFQPLELKNVCTVRNCIDFYKCFIVDFFFFLSGDFTDVCHDMDIMRFLAASSGTTAILEQSRNREPHMSKPNI